jgi:hypothetical protein
MEIEVYRIIRECYELCAITTQKEYGPNKQSFLCQKNLSAPGGLLCRGGVEGGGGGG